MPAKHGTGRKKPTSQSKWKRGVGSEFLMKGQSGAVKGVFGKKVNTGKKLSHSLGSSGKSRAVRGKSAICTLKGCDEKADTCYIRQVKNIELSFSLIVSAQPRLSQTPRVNLTVCPSLLTQVIQVSPSTGRTEEFSGVVPGLHNQRASIRDPPFIYLLPIVHHNHHHHNLPCCSR